MNHTWHTFTSAYLATLRGRAQSPETVALRRSQLARVAADHRDRDPLTLTTDDLSAWLGARDWSRSTTRSHRAAVRGLYAWAKVTGRVDVDPAALLPPVGVTPPSPRPTPVVMYREALMRADERERLMLRLAAEIGLRRGEVSRVHERDLEPDLLGWSLRVHGKGSRERVIPLTDDLARAIRRQAQGGWCFPGRTGGHLSAAHVGVLVSRLFPDGWTMHKLRHKFASDAHAVDHDLVTVQQLLGHASLATTQAYVATTTAAKRRLVEAVAA